MADIALLVVEESEKRKRWAKEDAIEVLNQKIYSYASAVGKKVEERVSSVEMVEVLRRALQPRSSVGMAASDGLFSA